VEGEGKAEWTVKMDETERGRLGGAHAFIVKVRDKRVHKKKKQEKKN